MALEREALYAMEFPFVDYGIDLELMAQMEKGIRIEKMVRTDIDANPPKHVEEKVEECLKKVKARSQDIIPIGFHGKGPRGYILKELVRHRGRGAPKVNKDFKDVVRLYGTPEQHKLSKAQIMRMKAGGPRYASMGNKSKK